MFCEYVLKAFRGIRIFNPAHSQAVIASDDAVYEPDLRLSCIRPLVLESVFHEPTV